MRRNRQSIITIRIHIVTNKKLEIYKMYNCSMTIVKGQDINPHHWISEVSLFIIWSQTGAHTMICNGLLGATTIYNK